MSAPAIKLGVWFCHGSNCYCRPVFEMNGDEDVYSDCRIQLYSMNIFTQWFDTGCETVRKSKKKNHLVCSICTQFSISIDSNARFGRVGFFSPFKKRSFSTFFFLIQILFAVLTLCVILNCVCALTQCKRMIIISKLKFNREQKKIVSESIEV